jgi:hypothetical protein
MLFINASQPRSTPLYSFVVSYIQYMRITSSLSATNWTSTVNSAQLNESARSKFECYLSMVRSKKLITSGSHSAQFTSPVQSNWNKLSNDTSSAPPMHASPNNCIALMPIHRRKHTHVLKLERRCLVSTQHAVWKITRRARTCCCTGCLFQLYSNRDTPLLKKDICKFVRDVVRRRRSTAFTMQHYEISNKLFHFVRLPRTMNLRGASCVLLYIFYFPRRARAHIANLSN